jgi:hypothetical protein
VYAARDLAAGATYDGSGAFSLTHDGRSKARDDIAQLLTDVVPRRKPSSQLASGAPAASA